MGIAEGDVDGFVAHPLGDGQCGEAHVDQQRNMAVPQIMHPDDLDAALLTAPLHAPLQGLLGEGEDPGVRLCAVQMLHIVSDLVAEELGHLDVAVAFLGLGIGDDILSLDPLVGLANHDDPLVEVKVRGGQGQKLAFPESAPVQQLEGVIVQGRLHLGIDEFEKFLLRPEQHLLGFLLAHAAGSGGGIAGEAVVADGVVEQGTHLVVHILQIGAGVGLAVGVRQLPHFILPADDVSGCDVRELPLAQVGQDLGLDETFLVEPGVELQFGLDICLVELVEALQGHAKVGLFLHQKLPFPIQSLPLGGKAPLQLLLPLALPVGVAELDIPLAAVFILIRRHWDTSLFLGLGAVDPVVEELPVDAAVDDDTAGLLQLLVQLTHDLIGEGFGNPQLLGHLVDLHEQTLCHNCLPPDDVIY